MDTLNPSRIAYGGSGIVAASLAKEAAICGIWLIVVDQHALPIDFVLFLSFILFTATSEVQIIEACAYVLTCRNCYLVPPQV